MCGILVRLIYIRIEKSRLRSAPIKGEENSSSPWALFVIASLLRRILKVLIFLYYFEPYGKIYRKITEKKLLRLSPVFLKCMSNSIIHFT